MVVAEPSPSAAYEGVSKEVPVTAISLDTALENLGIGWFQYRLLFMCGLNFMADSIEVSLLSFVSVCVGVQWSLTQIELASITSTVFAGALISSVFIWGYVADTYGRRIAFMSGCLLISIGGICTALSPNLYVLLISLFMVGMGNGCIFVPFDLLAEFLPANSRGYFLIVINYFWTMGSILVAGFAWLLLDIAGWRALALVSALPVGIACVLSVLYLPESPRWLLLKGRTSEAVAVLNEAAEVNGISLGDFVLDVPDPLACGHSNLVEESGSADTTAETEVVSSSNESGEEESTRWMDLLEYPVRWVTLSLWVVYFAYGMSYYGIILFISRLYTRGATVSTAEVSFAYGDILMDASGELLGVFVASCLIDRIGRRTSFAWFYLICGVSCILMVLHGPPGLVFSLMARVFSMAAGGATWVATPELFRTSLRALGHSSASALSRIGAMAVPYIVQNDVIDVVHVAWVLGALNFLAAVASVALPETLGKDIESDFAQSSSLSCATCTNLSETDPELPTYSVSVVELSQTTSPNTDQQMNVFNALSYADMNIGRLYRASSSKNTSYEKIDCGDEMK